MFCHLVINIYYFKDSLVLWLNYSRYATLLEELIRICSRWRWWGNKVLRQVPEPKLIHFLHLLSLDAALQQLRMRDPLVSLEQFLVLVVAAAELTLGIHQTVHCIPMAVQLVSLVKDRPALGTRIDSFLRMDSASVTIESMFSLESLAADLTHVFCSVSCVHVMLVD